MNRPGIRQKYATMDVVKSLKRNPISFNRARWQRSTQSASSLHKSVPPEPESTSNASMVSRERTAGDEPTVSRATDLLPNAAGGDVDSLCIAANVGDPKLSGKCPGDISQHGTVPDIDKQRLTDGTASVSSSPERVPIHLFGIDGEDANQVPSDEEVIRSAAGRKSDKSYPSRVLKDNKLEESHEPPGEIHKDPIRSDVKPPEILAESAEDCVECIDTEAGDLYLEHDHSPVNSSVHVLHVINHPVSCDGLSTESPIDQDEHNQGPVKAGRGFVDICDEEFVPFRYVLHDEISNNPEKIVVNDDSVKVNTVDKTGDPNATESATEPVNGTVSVRNDGCSAHEDQCFSHSGDEQAAQSSHEQLLPDECADSGEGEPEQENDWMDCTRTEGDACDECREPVVKRARMQDDCVEPGVRDKWLNSERISEGTTRHDDGMEHRSWEMVSRSEHMQPSSPEVELDIGRDRTFSDSSLMSSFAETEDDPELPAIVIRGSEKYSGRSTSASPVLDYECHSGDEAGEVSPSCVVGSAESGSVEWSTTDGTDGRMAELRLMLDTMLTEKFKKENDKKLAAQIDEDLRRGGITQFSFEDFAEVDETELLPEHKAKLKQLEVQNCQICSEAPGILLFDGAKVHKLFSYPSTLTLADCGFIPGKSPIDKMLSTSDPGCLSELLISQLIQMFFDSLSCPDAFMDWVFLTLSDLSDDLLSSSCLKILLDLLQRDHGKGSQWIPTPLTLARVLVNYGATLTNLLPKIELVDFTDSDLSLTNNKENSQPDANPIPSPLLPPRGQWHFQDGLRHVLRVMAEAIHKRPHLYRIKDLLAITVMLLRVSLDENLINNCLMHDMKLCISAILNAVPSETWKSFISQLCELAPDLATHHHNLLQLVDVLPPSERGITLQHHLSYVFLCYLCFGNRQCNFMDLKIRHLVPMVKSFQIREGTDFYYLYSVCVLLDRCVSKKSLPLSEKADLKVLCESLKSLMGSVRECISDLDRSVVKEMLTQLISILSIKLESMGFRQHSMFEYMEPHDNQQSLATELIKSNQLETEESNVSQLEDLTNSQQE